MPGRRRIATSAPLRSSLADAAFAVEERVVWNGADALRGRAEVVKWPFERIAWALERRLVWPLEARTDRWDAPLRALAFTALALLAAGAGVLGMVWASDSGGSSNHEVAATIAPAPAGAVHTATAPKVAPAEPTLHGSLPNFAAGESRGAVVTGKAAGTAATGAKGGSLSGSGGNAPSGSGGESPSGSGTTANSTSEVARSAPSGTASSAKPVAASQSPGPAALAVAHRFAGAFVLYEIGREDPAVAKTFAATATPRLSHRLLANPPRLPADGKVPQAKVLNIVAGPREGDAYTLSASLLRVGVTSELRLTVERSAAGKWQVANILG
jgi:hypothetical protein